MKHIIATIVCCAFVSGCASQAEQFALQDDSICQHTPNVDYGTCRQELENRRRAAYAQMWRDYQRTGRTLYTPPQTVIIQRPPPEQPAQQPPAYTPSCAEGYQCMGRHQDADGVWR